MKTTPSAEALELAKQLEIERIFYNFAGGMPLDRVATLIDTALALARLEGARVMQDYAARYIEASYNVASGDANWERSGEPYGPCIETRDVANDIIALDPQQVINEGVK